MRLAAGLFAGKHKEETCHLIFFLRIKQGSPCILTWKLKGKKTRREEKVR